MIINNAGMSGGGNFFNIQPSRIQAMTNCNFKAAFMLNR